MDVEGFRSVITVLFYKYYSWFTVQDAYMLRCLWLAESRKSQYSWPATYLEKTRIVSNELFDDIFCAVNRKLIEFAVFYLLALLFICLIWLYSFDRSSL